jgi:hypothetical protein
LSATPLKYVLIFKDPNLNFHRDHYTLPQSYNTTSESIDEKRTTFTFNKHGYL